MINQFRKTFLAVSVSAACVGAAQADSFFDDATLDIKLRNVYFNEMGRSEENKKDRREWVQAIIADYKSGYFMDTVGFDLSAGGAWGLSNDMDGSKNSCKASNLPVDGGDKTKCDTNDIGGVHQAYAKFKQDFDDLELRANFGKKKRSFHTFSDSGSRALPSASYGFEADVELYGLGLYGANITASSPRNQSYFKEDLTDGNGNDIDYMRIFGASYQFDFGLGLAAEVNETDEYLKQNWMQADYQFELGQDMSLELAGRYGEQDDNGDLMAKHESKFYDLVATLTTGPLETRIGFTKVSDGEWLTENFDEDHGTWDSNASLFEDFNAQDEKTWLVGAAYDFSEIGLTGFSVEAYYAKGTGGKDGNTKLGDQWERGTVLSYDFAGDLKGLNVSWENYTNRGWSGDRDADSNRVYVNYNISVF